MNKIKLLAALAVPAMFAACSNEEILVESPLVESEIVGAELVGTGISINAGFDAVESRYVNGSWEMTDQLGLGWIVTTGSSTAQVQTIAPTKDELYANNMFAKEEADGEFVTNGNIYKGWHFAYYPYERMDQVGKKTVTINPDQETLWNAVEGARFDDRFAISARHFLSSDDVNPETNQLDSDKKFTMEWASNEIAIHLVPSGSFTTSKYLNDLAITKVTLSDNANAVYAATATLYAKEVPSVKNAKGNDVYSAKKAEEKIVDGAKTREALLNALPKYLVGDYTKSIATNINVEMKTGVGGSTRIFTLPYVNSKKVISAVDIVPTIRVDVEGGYFTIAKVKNAEEGSLDAENNAQLDALIAAYAEEGKFTTAENIGRTQQVTLNLQEKNFKPDFSSISTYKEWQQCVNIVNALGFTKAQTFTIDGDIEVTGTSIALPKNCKLIVKAKSNKKLVIKKTLKSWPAADKMDASNIDVVFDANNTISQQITAKSITNNATMTIAAGTAAAKNTLTGNITNNGTIIVSKYAEVSSVDNEEGRIEIIYGGIANASPEGVIFYTVKGDEYAYQINNLMTEGKVNTFVVNSGIEFDLNNTDINGANSDEYDPSSGTSETLNTAELALVKIEMNGGAVKGLKNGTQSTVAEIEVITGETNNITDVKAGLITATAGTLTMDATTYLVGTALHKYELDMKAATTVDVKAGATLIANANTHVNVLNNAGIVLANDDYLFHFNSGVNTGTLTGEVEECDCVDTPDFTELENAVKLEWDAWKTAAANVGKTFEQSYVKELINSLSVADLTSNTKNSAKFYNVLKNWFEAKGMTIMSTSTFDGTDIIGFNYANEGTTNDLAY